MKKKLLMALLLGCIAFSSPITSHASSDQTSAMYKDAVMRQDYVGQMVYDVPSDWEYKDNVKDNLLTRTYTIGTGQLFMIFYTPMPNNEKLSNDYSFAAAIAQSATQGLTNYKEISRQKSFIGDFPALALSYSWTGDSGELAYSFTATSVTNDGAYIFTETQSSVYRDSSLEKDVWEKTIGSLIPVSYDSADIVKQVQQNLNDAGYECGTPDGISGSGTKSAIQKYRTDFGLSDGDFIDAELMNSFNASISHASNQSGGSSTLGNERLRNAKIFEADVYNGTKTDVIGKRAYIIFPKESFKEIAEEDYSTFLKNNVEGKNYNWFSIIFDDGTGINFSACFSAMGTYGKLDSEGCITESVGLIIANNEGGYTYEPMP